MKCKQAGGELERYIAYLDEGRCLLQNQAEKQELIDSIMTGGLKRNNHML